MKVKFWMFVLCSLFSLTAAFGQTLTVKGSVVDENGEPLPGVSIVPKSAPQTGTVSNIDGHFVLKVKTGDKLTFSFIGYESRELPAAADMKVKLEPGNLTLNDVVVVGYMERKVANTSASVVKVGAKDLAMKPVANPLDAVQGKVSGLQMFSSSGEPSARLSMALHGQGSLGAGTGLLVIMDGMQVSMAVLQSMNPNEGRGGHFHLRGTGSQRRDVRHHEARTQRRAPQRQLPGAVCRVFARQHEVLRPADEWPRTAALL